MKSRRVYIYIPGGTIRRRRVKRAEGGCALPPSRLGVAVPSPPRPGCENQERELCELEERDEGGGE